METSVSLQAAALGKAAVIGLALGLVYDLLRPLRFRSGKVGAVLLDMLFCAASGTAAFFYAMGAGDGHLGVCELGAMTLGFLLYLYIVADKLINRSENRRAEKRSRKKISE